jgi:hypothetical protein
MRAAGIRGVLIYCSDYRCSHWTTLSTDKWPDGVRLSDLEPRFICQSCGRRGADVRPRFDWEIEARRPHRSVYVALGLAQAVCGAETKGTSMKVIADALSVRRRSDE